MEKIVRHHLHHITTPSLRVGATYVPDSGTYIRLWAPYLEDVEIEWQDQKRQRLAQDDDGYYYGLFPEAGPGARYYFYDSNGENRFADPASRHQPEGVFGPSAVVDSDYQWRSKDWRGIPFNEWVLYEIHTGTFSQRHDFQGIIEDLPRLKALGITTIELMPVAPFPGRRNWGYDGVFPHAVQHSYGGPEGLKALVDACHTHELAIILDVVFNHLGPEGNVLYRCAPYIRDRHHTPWGNAINFDGQGSDHVRHYFLQAAWQWLTEYHFDGLRIDAVHSIFDDAPLQFLEELSHLKQAAEKKTGRTLALIAETDMNDPQLVIPPEQHGLGMEAHWADDLHHIVHATLTGEKAGYYADYTGGPEQLARLYRHKLAYDGQYSEYRQRHHGRSYAGIHRKKLVVSAQNHDQVGNRAFGERLAALVGFEQLKLAAACVLLSPFTPLIFMGEERALKNPFLYFVDHHSPALREAVRQGRHEEWQAFKWDRDPPDPGAPESFEQCVLDNKNIEGTAQVMSDYYRALIGFSRQLRGLKPEVSYQQDCAMIVLNYPEAALWVILSFSSEENFYDPSGGEWSCVLQSARYQSGHDYRGEQSCVPGRRLNIAPYSATVLRSSADG